MATSTAAANRLAEFTQRHPRLVILTGAGVSAASGIPTYRDAQGRWQYSAPIQHWEFLSDESTRRRYWARSLAGWPAVRDALPNAAHRALARLEDSGGVELLITQNVDRLHQRAGSRRVLDLHGRLDRVRCLDCGELMARETLQHWLERHNGPARSGAGSARPDGDSQPAEIDLNGFQVPACVCCGGTLIPDVVFFGGSVPRARVDAGLAALARADALLAVGSSLQVYSGYRFCRSALAWDKPIAIVNPGKTRADDIAALKLDCAACEVLGDVFN